MDLSSFLKILEQAAARPGFHLNVSAGTGREIYFQ